MAWRCRRDRGASGENSTRRLRSVRGWNHTRPENDTQRTIFTLELNNSMISLKRWVCDESRIWNRKRLRGDKNTAERKNTCSFICWAGTEHLSAVFFVFVLWNRPDWFLTRTFSTICSSADDKITHLVSGFHCWTRTAFIKEHHKCFFLFFLFSAREKKKKKGLVMCTYHRFLRRSI